MKREALEHQKLYVLADELVRRGAPERWKLIIASGVVERLWGYAGLFAPTGEIHAHAMEKIARFIGWPKKAADLIDALRSSKLIDRVENRLVIHDWSEHCDRWVHRKLVRAQKSFADGRAPKIVYSDTSERTGQPGGKPAGQPPPGSGSGTGPGPGKRKAATPPGEPFDWVRSKYPKRAGGDPRGPALASWRARLREGVSAQELESAVERYAQFCAATGLVGTQFVLQMSSFLGPNKRGYLEAWEIPPARPNVTAPANGSRKLKLVDGRVVDVKATQRVQFCEDKNALPIYELPNGTLAVKAGATWL